MPFIWSRIRRSLLGHPVLLIRSIIIESPLPHRTKFIARNRCRWGICIVLPGLFGLFIPAWIIVATHRWPPISQYIQLFNTSFQWDEYFVFISPGMDINHIVLANHFVIIALILW